MDSSDAMFGIILLGFVLSGMTARAEYLRLKRGRKPSEKSRPLAVTPPCLSPRQDRVRRRSLGRRPCATRFPDNGGMTEIARVDM